MISELGASHKASELELAQIFRVHALILRRNTFWEIAKINLSSARGPSSILRKLRLFFLQFLRLFRRFLMLQNQFWHRFATDRSCITTKAFFIIFLRHAWGVVVSRDVAVLADANIRLLLVFGRRVAWTSAAYIDISWVLEKFSYD